MKNDDRTPETKKEERFRTEKAQTAVEARADAQWIAWGPFVFHAARSMRDLGILEELQKRRKKGASIEEVAEALGLSIYGVRVLMEAGLGMGLLFLNDADRYVLSKTGFFILNDRMTQVNMDFVQDVCYEGIQHLDESISKGRPEGLKVFGEWSSIYEGLSKLPEKAKESWFAFDNYYSAQAFEDLTPYVLEHDPDVIYDVGGNIGKFSLHVLQADPDVRVKIFDLPGQLEMARERLKEKGLEDRTEFRPIDLLDPDASLPKGADLIWMSQFLDCFSEDEILSILQRAREALNDGGVLLILETFWDRQRFEAGSFSLQQISLYFTAMANGNSQMYHSELMIEKVREAGLEVVNDVDDLGIGHTLLTCRKKD